MAIKGMIWADDALAMGVLDNLLMSSTQLPQDAALRVMNELLHDHPMLQNAIDVVDSAGAPRIVEYRTPKYSNRDRSFKRRFCWRVPSSHSEQGDYMCLENHCPCRSHYDLVRKHKGSPLVWCKHLVAVRIASICGMIKVEDIREETFYKLMLGESTSSEAVSGGSGPRAH